MHFICMLTHYFLNKVNGGWGSWNSWSPCSETCGNGTQKRTRVCNDPEPDNGGLECPGNSTEFKTCIMDDCRGKLTKIYTIAFLHFQSNHYMKTLIIILSIICYLSLWKFDRY